MDIITHTLSGVAIATTIAAFSNKSLWKKGFIIGCGGIGGSLPDIDALSRWSQFDATIGKIFRLSHTGREIYFSNYW